jgi:MFS transporter, ACS family, allantoate permease
MNRNRIPWIIIGICYLLCASLLLVIRHLLAKENRVRDQEPPDENHNDVYIKAVDGDGNMVWSKVDKVKCSLK